MKNSQFKSIILIVLVSFLNASNKFMFTEKVGVATNVGSNESVQAVAYGLAKSKTDDIYVQNERDYKTPGFVDKLPPKKPIETGGAEAADTVPSVEDYYDGTRNIKHSVSFCQQFITKPQACTNQGNCGWCMGSGSCVSGSAAGPTNNIDCLRGQYVFNAPNKDWNPISDPNVRVARMNVGGAQLTTITQQP